MNHAVNSRLVIRKPEEEKSNVARDNMDVKVVDMY